MTKFTDDEIFFIFSDMRDNSHLYQTFQEEMTLLKSMQKYAFRETQELYSLAYGRAKKRIENENI